MFNEYVVPTFDFSVHIGDPVMVKPCKDSMYSSWWYGVIYDIDLKGRKWIKVVYTKDHLGRVIKVKKKKIYATECYDGNKEYEERRKYILKILRPKEWW